MSPEEREKKRLWMVEYNRRRKAAAAKTDLDTRNAIHGTRFRLGQQITVRGRRYTVTGTHGKLLRIKNNSVECLAHLYDAYPVINLPGFAPFDGWAMCRNEKLKIKKGKN